MARVRVWGSSHLSAPLAARQVFVRTPQMAEILATVTSKGSELISSATDALPDEVVNTVSGYYAAAQPTLVQIQSDEWMAILVTVIPGLFGFFAFLGVLFCSGSSSAKISPAPLPKKPASPPPKAGNGKPANGKPAPPPAKGTPGKSPPGKGTPSKGTPPSGAQKKSKLTA